MGFWRRARDSNPRTGYSPLHDFQEDSGSLKIVDIHRISPTHILVVTVKNDILIILISGIYVTAVVVFPSSKFVYHCENIYLFKQSRQTQLNKFKHLSKAGYRQEKGRKKAGKRREKLLGFDAGQQLRREGGRFSICREFLCS